MKGSVLCALIYDLVWNRSLQYLSGWAERSGATGVDSWDQEPVPGRSAPGAALASSPLGGGHTCTSFAWERRRDPPADGEPSSHPRDYDKLLIATISCSSLREISAALWR